MRILRYALLGLVSLAAMFAGPVPVAQAFTFTVNSTGNGDDIDQGDGVCETAPGNGVCTLLAAVQEANHANNAGLDTIHFSIGTGVQTIINPGRLGNVTITDPVIIDGTTQPGFAGSPIIELDGTGQQTVLWITAGGSTVKGLVINRIGHAGFRLTTNGGNTIQGNYIGTNVDGDAALGISTLGGILIENSANNTIGGTAAGEGNLISGNVRGIWIRKSGATGNVVQGNLIGTDVNGTADLGNLQDGIWIDGTASNKIGGTAAGAGNVISGNDRDGVRIFSAAATGNVVLASYFGDSCP